MKLNNVTRKFIYLVGLTLLATPLFAADLPQASSISATEALEFATPEAIERCGDLPGFWFFPAIGKAVGEGHASHMGRVGVELSDCPLPQADGTFQFRRGQLILTGSNGDKLFIAYEGVLAPVATTAIDGKFGVTATYEVAGGTGRFAGATGGGEVTGDYLFAEYGGVGNYLFTGILSSTGLAKKQ
jgi:hypothetical protein